MTPEIDPSSASKTVASCFNRTKSMSKNGFM